MDGGNWKEMFNAACEGNLELVKYHVERGVDVNYAHPEFLSTPLVACALAGQEHVALYLLGCGADPNSYSEFDAMTPLHAARKAGLATLEATLVEAGATEAAVPETRRRPSWFGRLLARKSA